MVTACRILKQFGELNRPIPLQIRKDDLTLDELKQALALTERFVEKLKFEYPQLRLKVVASLGYGVASREMSNLELFRKAASIFVKTDTRIESLLLQSLVEKIDSQRDYHRNKVDLINQIKSSCELRIDFLVTQMSIDENVKIELLLDEPDSDLIDWLNSRIEVYMGQKTMNSLSFSRVFIGRARDLLK